MRDFHKDPQALNLPWVFSPFFESILGSGSLGDRERDCARYYHDHGYAIIDVPVTDNATMDQAIVDLEGRYDTPATGYDVPSTRLDAWRWSEAVISIARAPSVLEVLEMLYGRKPIPFQTLSFESGSQLKAHSDTIHFHCVPQLFMAGVWVALEDIHVDSGPLMVYPGSHKLPVLDMHDLGLETGFDSYLEYEAALAAIVEAQGLEPREISPKRGQAVIWSANLLHGGAKIRESGRTRYNQVTHYYFEDCFYYQAAASDPFMGRLALKEVEEVGTQRILPNLYRGRSVGEWLQDPG